MPPLDYEVNSGGIPQLNDPLLPDYLPPSPRASSPLDDTVLPTLDDIKTEYHPSSGLPPRIVPFAEYDRARQPRPMPPEQRPWEPFRSRLDFEIAEIALEAALNRSQLDRLIKLIHRVAEKDEDDPFTILTAGEMKTMWDLASGKRTSVRSFTVS